MSGRLDPMAKARDFIYSPRPRVRPMSPARRLDQIERLARDASVSASTSGGGGSSVATFDALPDPTPEDLGNIIYVAGAGGEPARALMGVQTPDDRNLWEPIMTQAFYGAATEFLDELYSFANWVVVANSTTLTNGGIGHPGEVEIGTSAVNGNVASAKLGFLNLGDLDRSAFIFRTSGATTSVLWRIGFTNTASPPDGVYLEKISGETNWRVVKGIAAVQTRTDSGISGLTGDWFLFQVEYAEVAGSFLATLTDLTTGAAFSITLTGLNENAAVSPTFLVQTATTASRFIRGDYFWLRNRATVRS